MPREQAKLKACMPSILNAQHPMTSKISLTRRTWALVACVATGLAWLPVAAAAPQPGAPTDHPLIGHMPGYVLEEKKVEEFGVRKLDQIKPPGKLNLPAAKLTVEGRVTEISYTDEQERGTPVSIYRNHLNALRSISGEAANTGFSEAEMRGQRFLFRVAAAGAEPTWVMLDLGSDNYRYTLTVIEPLAMKQGITASKLADEIRSGGFATLHIQFDTAKAELKADGQAAVREIALLLRQDPALKLSIEGHTDNVGAAADNKKLSQARAEAVLKAVLAQGIAASRLSAAGKGQEVPVADNRTEAGRASNRRVELVKR